MLPGSAGHASPAARSPPHTHHTAGGDHDPDRGPVTHCAIPGCVLLGHFAPYNNLCPIHRQEVTIPPTNPDL